MDLNDIYGGIISPQGGLYKPQGSDVYSGIIPPSVPSSGLKTNTVNTVPINPITGNPYGAGSPPNEVKVPGGTNTGLGYQSGQSFPDSYRLLPTGPLSIAGETPATKAIQTATLPDMRGLPYGLGSRDTQAKQTAGQMFLAAMLGGATSQPYAGGGMLAQGAGDPWGGMATPGASGRKRGGTQPQRGPVAIPQPMRESTDGYVYQNGKAVGKADWAKDLTPSQQYDTANRRAKEKAIAKSSNPSKNAARASLAAQWGFD